MAASHHVDHTGSPDSKKTDFSTLLKRALSRRGFLKAPVAFGVSAFVLGTASPQTAATAKKPIFNFPGVGATDADTITVPEGYDWYVMISWGDPLFSHGLPFDPDTRGTGKSQELSLGDNNDGMTLFPISDKRGVFVVNNEYANLDLLLPNGIQGADDIRKLKAAHGVSLFEVQSINGQWKVVVDGRLNRRITADTPMEITGPARGHALMKTRNDPDGISSLGTWNNCGNGQTPWGTYLTCEENFNGYFGSADPTNEPTAMQKRYGVGNEDRGYSWYQYDTRFDISKTPNEENRCGYIVEIDPLEPTSIPKKRTALGRFKHENAEVVIAANGHVVVYSGDDERGEYLYRFVSKNRYQPDNDAANRELLAEGTLYVARFNEADDNLSGRGEWVELSHGKNGLTAEAGFSSQAEVLVFARSAATVVNATTMDRPEWVAAHPKKAAVYCALTNNKNRGKKPNRGGVETPVNGPNPRVGNLYGQIVRWRPDQADHSAKTFSWDLFVLAGNPTLHQGLNAGSNNIHPDNMFNGPDGIVFDEQGRLWIQTDGNYSNQRQFAGMGNNQMLLADTQSGEIARFLVGPVACEITGATWSPDRRTLFIGVQHPGEKGAPSHFPDGGQSIPRSSIVAITRKDNGIIGG